MTQLNWYQESNLISDKVKSFVKTEVIRATTLAFTIHLKKHPILLHLSCHGTADSCLIFEDENGCAIYITETQLKIYLLEAKPLPSVVFISACLSANIGAVFKQAGVQHVICIK